MNSLIFISFALVASALGGPLDHSHIPILSQTIDVGVNGQYSVQYETGNGIGAQEYGSRNYVGTNNEAALVQGNYAYTAPDGTPISVSYTADENGFRAAGAHLPTPPPIPAAIQRALEWIAANPQPVEPQRRF